MLKAHEGSHDAAGTAGAGRYADDELDFIEETSIYPRRLAHAAFCELFGRAVSFQAYKSLCARRGWRTGRTGQYEKGGRPAKYKPIGTERRSEEGYVERKIHDGLPLQSRWRGVHLINWEALHGQVPDGHCLKCLDGDRANTDPSNWACIPRAMMPRLCGRHGRGYDDAPAALKPVILATAELEHRARVACREKATGIPTRKAKHERL